MSTRSRLRTRGRHPLPYWLVTRVREGRVPAMVLNTVVLHRVILLTQVERMAEASAYDTSLNLRRVMHLGDLGGNFFFV